MGVRQYIGARYVPKFAEPIDWNSGMEYEALTIVRYNLGFYTSRKNVPAGTLPTDTSYWVLTGNYNEQIQEIINKFPLDTADIEDGAITKDKLDDELEEVFDAVLNGAVGDGRTDNYQTLQDLATEIKNAGGGILYLRSGVYNISKTLCIGDGVKLIGDGESSVINYTQSPSDWGVGVLVIGSNVMIKDIKVNYPVNSYTPSLTSGNDGAVGISSYDYTEALYATNNPGTPVNTYRDYDNIVIDNLSSNGWYPIQCEPTQAKTVSHLTYKNMHFNHDALVSLSGNTNGGVIKDSFIENVSGGYLRMSGDDRCENVCVNNAIFSYGFIHGSGCNFNNVIFDATEESLFDGVDFNYMLNIAAGTTTIKGSNFNNILINAANKKNQGIATGAYTNANITNVRTKNCLTHGIVGATGQKLFIVNAEFDTTNGQINTGIGSGVNVKGNTQVLSRYVFDDHVPGVTVPSTHSVITDFPQNIYMNGNIIRVTIGVQLSAVGTGVTILRITTPPETERYVMGFEKIGTALVPISVIIDTQGFFKVGKALDGTSAIGNGREIYLDTSYTIGPPA